jgi:hypothetical protein
MLTFYIYTSIYYKRFSYKLTINNAFKGIGENASVHYVSIRIAELQWFGPIKQRGKLLLVSPVRSDNSLLVCCYMRKVRDIGPLLRI